MQGILKSSHQRLCDCLEEFNRIGSQPDHKLNELEAEICSIFLTYQKKMIELKQLIRDYEEKEKLIRHQIKRLKKHTLI